MRTAFHEQLDKLSAQLADMCGLAATAMEDATVALLHAELSVAEHVIADQENIVAMSRQVEEAALRLLALQQPVARDLRTVVGAIHVAADIERMGALAAHVAGISRLRHPDCALPGDVRDRFTEMGEKAVRLARIAQEVLLSRDPEQAALLRDKDDAIDTEHRRLFTLLIDQQWQSSVCSAVDVALLGRYYERFADHAVEIGRRVVFEATGGLPQSKQMA